MNNTIFYIFITGIICFGIGYFAGTKETKKLFEHKIRQLWNYVEMQEKVIKKVEPFIDEQIEEYQMQIDAEKAEK